MSTFGTSRPQRQASARDIALPYFPDWGVHRHGNLFEFPVHYMRGGTSTGVVIWEPLAPSNQELREELLRHLMGVPLAGVSTANRQITGLGRGPATSNKVFFIGTENVQGRAPRLVSTLAQLASQTSAIDWSVNCGNMSSAIPLWALDVGLLNAPKSQDQVAVDIRNTNTGVITTVRLNFQASGTPVMDTIPGVDGAFPSVDLFLHDPVGAKTGALLPTGQHKEIIFGHAVTCIDVAVPMVIVDAQGFGKTAHEPITDLEADQDFMRALREVWIEAGLRMGLRDPHGNLLDRESLARSETIPKVCIVGPPRADGHISARYFTPQTGHTSLAVSGACCIAAACLLPGSVANQVARNVPPPHIAGDGDDQIGIENPAGTLLATVVSRQSGEQLLIRSVAYRRSAQLLLRGRVPIYQPSQALHDWLEATNRNPA